MRARPPLILVVDDDPSVRRAMELFLRSAGFATASAGDGATATERAGALYPDVVLMDLRMPGMDGWEAMRALREAPATAAIPVVAMTAEGPLPEQVRAAGFRGLLDKPFPVATLLAEIRSHLRPTAVPTPVGAAADGPLEWRDR